MKLSQLSLADYNQLDSIPVINQDLSASGFTPVANTYYRHTGATTDTFTQGVIYLYDTAYHKLGESGGDYLTYKGGWVSGNEYHENDVVTYSGNLYEVVTAGANDTPPDATPSMYLPMTASTINDTLIPVYFDAQGGYFTYNVSNPEYQSPILIQLIPYGKAANQPSAPAKTGKSFDAWYTDPVDDNTEFNFGTTPVTKPLVLYAQWV